MATDSNKELLNIAAHSCIEEYLNEEQGEIYVTVSGDCMSPVLKDSELISIKPQSKYVSGDIVAFHSSQYGRHMVHRVLGVIPFQGRTRYFIKADDALHPDVIVDEQDILGCASLVSVNIWRRLYCFIQCQCWIAITTIKKMLNGLRR